MNKLALAVHKLVERQDGKPEMTKLAKAINNLYMTKQAEGYDYNTAHDEMAALGVGQKGTPVPGQRDEPQTVETSNNGLVTKITDPTTGKVIVDNTTDPEIEKQNRRQMGSNFATGVGALGGAGLGGSLGYMMSDPENQMRNTVLGALGGGVVGGFGAHYLDKYLNA